MMEYGNSVPSKSLKEVSGPQSSTLYKLPVGTGLFGHPESSRLGFINQGYFPPYSSDFDDHAVDRFSLILCCNHSVQAGN